jgi:hypothetical protein
LIARSGTSSQWRAAALERRERSSLLARIPVSPTRLVLGEGQHLTAIGKERGVARVQVHVASVELGEVSDEERRCTPVASGEALEPDDELVVRQPPE